MEQSLFTVDGYNYQFRLAKMNALDVLAFRTQVSFDTMDEARTLFARVLEKLGAAKIILNENINKDTLSEDINDILSDETEMKKMGERAKKIAKYDVEEKIYEEIKELVDKNRK